MPAIQVARTDTFEQQRQKINQLGSAVFNITAGGSDLSTGNLKLGDGTKSSPSLSFTTNSSLGIYKSLTNGFGFVGNNKKIIDFSSQSILSYKDIVLQQKVITTSGLSIINFGSNYDPGTYANIPIIGGTGENGTLNISVVSYSGTITTLGSNYYEGTFTGIPLTGGSGSGAIVSFNVDGIDGTIVPGSSYIPGTYNNVSLTGGSGTGAKANISITGTISFAGTITNSGSSYYQGQYTNVRIVNSPTSTFTITAVSNPGTPPPTNVFAVNGTAQQTISCIIGNTYWFDLSDSSISQLPFSIRTSSGQDLVNNPNPNFILNIYGTQGQSGCFAQLIIKPTATTTTLTYYALSTNNVGGTINVITGSSGNYGSGGLASVVVNSSGNISSFSITSSGSDYKQSDVLTILNIDVGGYGSGFLYTLGAPTYNGIVTSVNVIDNGINYLKNNVLTAPSSSLGGQGSGFSYTITSDPGIIKDFVFTSRGSGYQPNNILELPKQSSNQTVNIPGQVSGVSTTLSTSSPTITVASTANLFAGMAVFNGQTDVGQVPQGTTILTIDSNTSLTLSATPTIAGSASLTFSSGLSNSFTVSNASSIILGSIVEKISGNGVLGQNTVVSSINTTTNTVTITPPPTLSGTTVIKFIPPFGDPTTDFQYTINQLGTIDSISVVSGGNGYFEDDILSVLSSDLTSPIQHAIKVKDLQKITFAGNIPSSSLSVGDILNEQGSTQSSNVKIYYKATSGSNISYLIVNANSYQVNDVVYKTTVPGTTYTISTVENIGKKYFIDDVFLTNLTLYSGNTYIFDFSDSSNLTEEFALSSFSGGSWIPSLIENISTTLSTLTKQITVSSTTNILPGMKVSVTSGSGTLLSTTVVETVNSQSLLTLSQFPLQSGSVILSFSGVEYTNAVTRTATSLKIKISDDTPDLYFYSKNNAEVGSYSTIIPILITNNNNPKQFGSGLSIRVLQTDIVNVITSDIETGDFSALKLISEDAEIVNASIDNLTAPSITSTIITATAISSVSNLNVSATSLNLTGNFNIGSTFQILGTNGNLTTSGNLKTLSSLNVNDRITITNNTISSTSGYNIILSPPSPQVVKINSSSAITIPSGTTAQRPSIGIVESGSIRFNTDTNQYEGYSGNTTSWSSLGGVRDLDGNTYITAEFTIGSNDNTLWFYNDNNNTVKFTPEYQEFVSVKKIRSINTSAPTFVNWAANTPVTVGQYLKYRNNIYEVVTAGVTGTAGNEPINTTGTNFANGTATLKFFITAVAPLTFEEISEVRIAPDGGTSLSINNDLRFATNVISTDTNDLLLRPNSGKKVTVDAKTSLVLPVGTTNERGAPVRGSVRFNTTILQYEGYDGANWSSLGGVRDVDGNTYIIPELTPGGNQNILYFYNNGSNTLRVTENEIQLDTIDTITSPTSNALNLEASLVTFNNLAASIDTSSATRTFISTTKDNLDLGLSSGLVNDPLLRLSDTGDIFYNLGFGTGVYNGVKVFDKGLKELELADYKIFTEDVTLTKNTVDAGSSIAYDPSIHRSAKVQIVAHNETTGDKEFLEYSVIDKGSDIFHTDFGNVKTGAELISSVFDFDANNRVRVTFTLDSAISAGNVVKVTVISNIIKR